MDSFYRAFEDRHRGPRDLIKDRLRKYSPFVEPLAKLYPGAKTFDIGCGRGEWLELMIEAGFAATGVDLDADMLDACRERNLPAFQGDAIERLAALDSDSHALISAFHVVEHVSFEQLKTLVSDALRVLKPGGLLILETPNPENIAVATCNFYMDPSHQKPVPPLLLSFVAEHAGFDRVKVVRLQEAAALRDASTDIHFLNVLGGVSPDYAVVAQKDAGSTHDAFDDAFNAEYGLTIDVLAQRYEERLGPNTADVKASVQRAEEALRQSEERRSQLLGRLDSMTAQLRAAEERYRHIEERCQRLEQQYQDFYEQSRLADGERQQIQKQMLAAQARLQQMELVFDQTNAQLRAVYDSTSWRITSPIRMVGIVLKGQGKPVCKTAVKRLIRRTAKFGEKHPLFWRAAVSVLNRVPGVKQRLIHVVVGTVRPPHPRPDVPPEGLSPRAQEIHAALVFAAKSYKKEEA